jgi:hypothetical protein
MSFDRVSKNGINYSTPNSCFVLLQTSGLNYKRGTIVIYSRNYSDLYYICVVNYASISHANIVIIANLMTVNFDSKSVKMFIVHASGADPIKLFVINLNTQFCKLDCFIIRISQLQVSVTRWQHGPRIIFAPFISLKNHKIANDSITTGVREKVSTDPYNFWMFAWLILKTMKFCLIKLATDI